MPGGLFALFFILYTAYRVLRRRTGATWLHMLLAFGAIASFGASSGDRMTVMLIVGGAAALAGIILMVIEQRLTKPGFNQSQGLLTIGVSILLLVSALAGPTIASTLTRITQEAVATAQEPTSEASVDETAPTQTPIPAQNAADFATNTPVPTQTFAAAEVTLQNPLPTRYIYTTPVPTETVVNVVSLCQGVTENNLNLRSEPSAESELLLTIPHSTYLPVYGRNADATWLYVSYNDQSGWVSADYMTLNTDCGDLAVQES
jgi:hypothetical protein